MEPTSYELERARFSEARLVELRAGVAQCRTLEKLPNLSVFVAGSYGRHEASEHSDIDPFFIRSEGLVADMDAAEVEQREGQFFEELKAVVHGLRFPPFTDDGFYLQTHNLDDIAQRMGGREDDWKNHFTARMLLLLEGRPIYNERDYDNVLSRIVDEYFRDYEGHESDFAPLFLLNDIHRYWKTLLINYEHSRNLPAWREQYAAARVKNFKLGFSRMTTCLATIAAVSSCVEPVDQTSLLRIFSMTPRERLRLTAEQLSSTQSLVREMAERYDAFLKLTALPTRELQDYFANHDNKVLQGTLSREYGALMFQLLGDVGKASVDRGGYDLIRYLVI